MSTISLIRRLAVAALLALSFQATLACNFNREGSGSQRLIAVASAHCAGMDHDLEFPGREPLNELAKTATQGPEAESALSALRASLTWLRDFAAERIKAGTQVGDWTLFVQELSDTIAKLDRLTESGDVASGLPSLIAPKWGQFARAMGQRDIVLADTVLKPLKEPCADGGSHCAEFASQLDQIRVINRMASLARLAGRSELVQGLARDRIELARWKAYRADAHHQYPWELALNGWLMKRHDCQRSADAMTGQLRISRCAVPTSMWILAHPDAGLRWSRDAASRNELKPALIIELLGYYRWSWAEKSGSQAATMKDRYGLSLAVAASQRRDNSVSRWSWGPMLHVGDWSFALTKARGGEWALLLNAKLADRVFLLKDADLEALAKVAKP